jgi:hypothetical protein
VAKSGGDKKTHMLDLFLKIYQLIWKNENEDVKLQIKLKICRNTVNPVVFLYIFCFLSLDQLEKRHCKAKHFFAISNLRFKDPHFIRVKKGKKL